MAIEKPMPVGVAAPGSVRPDSVSMMNSWSEAKQEQRMLTPIKILKRIHSTPTIPPDHIEFSRLLQFAHLFHAELSSRLEPEIGPIDDRLALFIAACSMITSPPRN